MMHKSLFVRTALWTKSEKNHQQFHMEWKSRITIGFFAS